ARCYGPPMPAPVTADYDARWGYRHFDARRYERRRYGGLVRGLNLRLLERVLARALAGVDGRRLVLDVPCGTGIIGGYLAARGFWIVGADISPPLLDVASGRPRAPGLPGARRGAPARAGHSRPAASLRGVGGRAPPPRPHHVAGHPRRPQ